MKSLLAALVLGAGLLGTVPVHAQFMNITSIVAGIGSRAFLDDVEALGSSADVRVVRLSTLAGAEQSRERLARTVLSQPRDIAYLHSTILLNPMARWAVRNAGVEVGQIVSLTVAGDAAAVLFADDL